MVVVYAGLWKVEMVTDWNFGQPWGYGKPVFETDGLVWVLIRRRKGAVYILVDGLHNLHYYGRMTGMRPVLMGRYVLS